MSSFPGSSVSKEPACSCRVPRFDPWFGKIPWRRKWQTTPVHLPGKFHGQRSLAGCSPWGRKESSTTERQTPGREIKEYLKGFSLFPQHLAFCLPFPLVLAYIHNEWSCKPNTLPFTTCQHVAKLSPLNLDSLAFSLHPPTLWTGDEISSSWGLFSPLFKMLVDGEAKGDHTQRVCMPLGLSFADMSKGSISFNF